METSLSDQQFSNSNILTATNSVDVKVTEGKCPICWQNNKISKIIPVFYKMRDAIYTCEDANCLYFVSDSFGNLQKFTKTNGTLTYSGNVTIPAPEFNHSNVCNVPNRISQSEPTQVKEIVNSSSYLDDIFNCESNNDDVESLINELSTDLQNFFENNQSKK